MDNQTIADPPAQNEQKARLIKIALLGSAFLVFCMLFGAAFTWFQPDQLSLSDRYFPTSTRTFTPTVTMTPTATLTPTPNLHATLRATLSTASAQAIQNTIANAGNQWQVLFSDPFDDNDRHWKVGTTNDEYAMIVREVKDGKYVWDATAKQGFIGWIPTSPVSLTDFYFSAEFKETSASSPAQYGLVFRDDSLGNFYYFAVEGGSFLAALTYNNQWIDLIRWTASSSIRIGEANRVTIIVQGPHFIFLINDQYVGDATNDRIAKGTAGLAIGLNAADARSMVEFDNVEIRTP